MTGGESQSQEPTGATRSARGLHLEHLAPLAALFAFGGLLGFQKIRSFDYWWHLRTGQWIAEEGRIPRTDPYTFTIPGEPWTDIHWLFQLGLHRIYEFAGHEGVVVAKVLLIGGLIALLATIAWRKERASVTAAVLGLMLLTASGRFMPRPELPSIVLLAAVLALLDRDARRADWWILVLAPIQVLWVNIHGLFALNIAVCGMAFVAELIRPLLLPGERMRRPRVRRLGAVTLLVLLATLVNPHGLSGALYPIQQLGMIGPVESRGILGSIIGELTPMLQMSGDIFPSMTAAALLAALSLAAMSLNWRRIDGLDPLLWVAFLYLSLGAYRNLALFAVVAAAISIRNLNEILDRRTLPRWPLHTANALVSAVLVLLCVDVTLGSHIVHRDVGRETGLGIFEPFHPVDSVDWIARENVPGPLFHQMADGGYLIWKLYPAHRVMLDGRLEVFGGPRLVALHALDAVAFQRLDEQFHFESALINYQQPGSLELLWWLHQSPAWSLRFVGEVASVFVRQGQLDSAVAIDASREHAELLPAFVEQGRAARDRTRTLSRLGFLSGFHRYREALAFWEETLTRDPEIPESRHIHAQLLHANGYPAAAEAILRQILEDRPGDGALHVRLGGLRLEAEDLATAREHFEQALVDPLYRIDAILLLAQIADLEGNEDLAARHYRSLILQAPPEHPASEGARAWLDSRGRQLQDELGERP